MLIAAGLSSCNLFGQKDTMKMQSSERTVETKNLLINLGTIHQKGFMFGHHDDPVYGIGWEGDADRSDVKSVCGDYPAVMSFDLGRIELGGDKTWIKYLLIRLGEKFWPNTHGVVWFH
ncbi:mannan endo-1,4-beta-mannosidase [Bacteroides graminisolvens DSM 19988 = JCM 15093]|uniref:Mannan endo-1,4-beta-mannosidase n=1 Tax=Bacteroides graminisolvens DSM 19988 = JCM 15093 TaxID=1121097 RepID=A0A069CZ21_9BACE|nr:mannan endo-1,4-beta-mannosidase [Bacteroides graminisolvens DSM 19988 = JCM 15093]